MSVDERKIVESILLLADEPVAPSHIAQVLERPQREVTEILEGLAHAYELEDRGFVLRRSSAGWRLYTNPDCAPWLERFVLRGRHTKLTGAALEVLAVIAYRQPIARAEISEIRGVDSDGVVRTLVSKGLVEASGGDSGPGSPVLLSVTDELVERLGLRSLGELPPLTQFMPDVEAVEDMEAKLSPGP
jgi:segregation and condensation protein B